MNNTKDTIKSKFKNCAKCISFITTRLFFVVFFGYVLGTVSSQAIESHPASKLFYEVKSETVIPHYNEINIKDKF